MIQTWLPFPNFRSSVRSLSDEHLGFQRLHVLHVIEVIHDVEKSDLPDSYDTSQDPTKVINMWRGHEMQLLEYGLEACDEWSSRIGRGDSLYPFIYQHLDWATSDISNMSKPSWFGDIDVHLSHQAELCRRDPHHYNRYFSVDPNLPMLWPESDNAS